MKKEQGAVFDRRVGALPNIWVTVYVTGTTNKPTIYSDNGINPQSNPFQTDSLGRWAFYVANGRYDIEFSGPMIGTFKLEDVLIEESGAGTFLQLTDTPSSYTGQSGKIATVKTGEDGLEFVSPGAPHASTHQNGGGDEISVAGLSGQLADLQPPLPHHSYHEDGGGDEISVQGLSGQLGEKQDANKIQGHTVDETAIADDRILVYKTTGDKFIYEGKGTPSAHASSHQDGGGDEINVQGLSGELADPQKSNFLKLSDTPSSYTDQGGKVVAVKSAEDGVEFVAGGGGSGNQRIRIPAAAFETRAAAGWAAFVQTQGTNFDYGELDFDKDTDEKAISPPFRFSNWGAGNITVRIGWKANATTGDVMWVVSFMGRDTTTPEAWDTAFTDHALSAETTPGTAEYLKESVWTGAVAELANNDAVVMKIARDADNGSDTLAVDAKLLYVEIEYTEA